MEGLERIVPENRYIPPYYRYRLKNGMEVYGIPINRGSKVVYSSLWIKAGSRNEVLGKTGIAHMLEHMSFKSTTHLKEGEFDKIVRSLGGVSNAATNFDYTFYYIKISNDYLETTFRLFREVLGELLLREDEFQREQQVVYEERLWRVDNNPAGYLFFRLFNNSYIYHPYHWTPIGFKQDILNWKIEDIRHFYETYYSPNNSFLLVAGDFEPEEVVQLAEKWFGELEPKEIPPVHQKEPPLDGEKWVEIRRETKAEKVVLGFPIPRFDSPDIVRLEILGELWTRGRSGRLIDQLFYKKRLVSSIYAYPMDLRDGGLFIIGATCNDGVDPKQVADEIRSFIDNYTPTPEELEKARFNTKYDFLSSFESSSGTGSLFGGFLAKGSLKPLLEYYRLVEELNGEEILALKKYFKKGITLPLYRS